MPWPKAWTTPLFPVMYSSSAFEGLGGDTYPPPLRLRAGRSNKGDNELGVWGGGDPQVSLGQLEGVLGELSFQP